MSALKEKLERKIENYTTETIDKSQFNANEGAIIPLKPNESTITNSIVPEFEITINEAKNRILMLQKFVKEMMIPNVDYGVIPRCNKQ